MELGYNELTQLSNLFNPKKDNSDDDDDDEPGECSTETRISGSNIEENAVKKKVNPYSKIEPETKNKEIYDENDFLEEQEKNTEKDWKKTPVWDITYKQQVTASDVFLQMGFKNPTTSSCEDMIVTIHVPGDSHYNIDLKIHKENLILVSPKYYLDLKLPQPVDPQQGNAKFDNETEKLVITLRMDRELDFVNF